MKTNDTTFRTNYIHNYSYHSLNNNNNEAVFDFGNNDSLSQRDTENTDNFDNYILCQKYGQPNIEKAILVLCLINLLSGIILYYYWNFLKLYFIRLLLISSSIDILLLLFYIALRIKFNSNDWFNTFPIQFYDFLDYIIIINFLLKTTTFTINFFLKIALSSIFLFSIKYLLELYLLLSCVKKMIFCPGYNTCSGYFEKGVDLIKFLLNCCEGQVERGYTGLSEDSSDVNYTDNSLTD